MLTNTSITRTGFGLLLAGSLLLSTACEKQLDSPKLSTSLQAAAADDYFVSEDEARLAAENIAASFEVWGQYNHYDANPDTQRVFWGRQTIKSFVPVQANDEHPAFYICNYKEGGYSVIAADHHMLPVLAFSEYGAFPTEDLQDFTKVSDGLITWMETTKEIVTALRANPSKENTMAGAPEAWRQQTNPCESMPMQPRSTSGGSKYEPLQKPSPCPPPPTRVVSKGPLVAARWGQGLNAGVDYNANCPATTNQAWGFHSPTGCVATAMAQVMYRWQQPTRYQWASMFPDRGTAETALLMADAGRSVNMDYRNTESGADTHDAFLAFRNTFGYGGATWITYSGNPGAYAQVQRSLSADRPVILRGKTDETSYLWVSWPSGAGHAWVCDGFLQVTAPIGNTGMSATHLMFNMNWGWDGQYSGLFQYGDWTIYPLSGAPMNFQYGQSAIIDLHP